MEELATPAREKAGPRRFSGAAAALGLCAVLGSWSLACSPDTEAPAPDAAPSASSTPSSADDEPLSKKDFEDGKLDGSTSPGEEDETTEPERPGEG